ncbi:hypothetical protein BC628DRAFT_98087 [Trametes gibbosa]|nr:hypothetical protein BC628DRAFT_98087 [Trametes gibbosa]
MVSLNIRPMASSDFGLNRQWNSDSFSSARVLCHSTRPWSAVGRDSGCRLVIGSIKRCRNSMLLYRCKRGGYAKGESLPSFLHRHQPARCGEGFLVWFACTAAFTGEGSAVRGLVVLSFNVGPTCSIKVSQSGMGCFGGPSAPMKAPLSLRLPCSHPRCHYAGRVCLCSLV